jgi:hypothetical protein
MQSQNFTFFSDIYDICLAEKPDDSRFALPRPSQPRSLVDGALNTLAKAMFSVSSNFFLFSRPEWQLSEQTQRKSGSKNTKGSHDEKEHGKIHLSHRTHARLFGQHCQCATTAEHSNTNPATVAGPVKHRHRAATKATMRPEQNPAGQ